MTLKSRGTDCLSSRIFVVFSINKKVTFLLWIRDGLVTIYFSVSELPYCQLELFWSLLPSILLRVFTSYWGWLKQHVVAAMSLVWFFDVVSLVCWRGGFECWYILRTSLPGPMRRCSQFKLFGVLLFLLLMSSCAFDCLATRALIVWLLGKLIAPPFRYWIRVHLFFWARYGRPFFGIDHYSGTSWLIISILLLHWVAGMVLPCLWGVLCYDRFLRYLWP